MKWDSIEDVDFYIETRGRTDQGDFWIGLVCSEHGPVQATAEGPPSDLADLVHAAQRHVERKHDQEAG